MVGQHIPDRDQADVEGILRDFDPVRLVRQVKEMGAQVFSFYAKCHRGNAYYPTKIGHRHSVMGGRDLFGEMVKACLADGIVPSTLYEMADLRVLEQRPEWCHQDGDGRPANACINGPYRQFALGQLEEILSGYPTFELLLDMVDFPYSGPEWACPYCEERFREGLGRKWSGKESDLTDEEMVRYISWRYAEVERFLKEVKVLRDKLSPGALLEHNFHGLYGWHWGNSLRVTSSLTDVFHTDLFAFRDGQLTDVLMPKMYRSHSPRRAVVLIDGAVCVSGDVLTPKPLPFYLSEAGCVVSHGLAYDSSICIDHTGAFDPHQMENIRRLNAAIAEREPWIHGGAPQSYAALVFPERTRDFVGKRKWWPYHDCLIGWMELLVENHILFDMVAELKLAETDLSAYGLLVLPDTASMTPLEVEAVRSFVAGGGVLVATGETSLAGENGERGDQFQLHDVFGVDLVQGYEGDRGCLVLTSPDAVDPDAAYSPWIPYLDEGQVEVRLTTAEARGVVGLRPREPRHVQLTPVRWMTDTPALTVNRFGKGTAYYFAGRIGGVYARYNYPAIRRLIARLLHPHANVGMRVVAEAPGCVYVEVTRQQDPPRYVVHLMNAQTQVHRHYYVLSLIGGEQRFPPVIAGETLPVHDARLGLLPQAGERITRIYQAPGEGPLDTRLESGRVWVTVPCVQGYDLVVFDVGET